MPVRSPVRRFFLVALLSQAMVIQALLLSWSAAIAATGDPPGSVSALCVAGGARRADTSGTIPDPGKPSRHHDCLATCVAAPVAADLPDQGPVLTQPLSASMRTEMVADLAWAVTSTSSAFLARAPPVLI